ncbi:uncharacterized protein Dana_GF26581 [Drosophila ananassae]|uniref:Uncharacterized protein n=1 Tax=Drosophila ananassae TaxID=7217 RepID=A0A0P8Y4S3_DROAN|nr:uncharacterized protein LOC26513990 [Drosophila ananassae]KPU76581.1 uncharacterized protein Dana_GF26581 [Drosophila ananassae]
MEPEVTILSIGTVTSNSSVNNQQVPFDQKFAERMKQILLDGAAPLNSTPDLDSIGRFAAKSIRRNGKQYYQFGKDTFERDTIISGPAFDPKSIVFLIKDRIAKEHWINENVIQFRNNSWPEIQTIVCDSIAEQDYQIYQFLGYLQSNQ